MREIVSSKACVIPRSPAVPKKSATTDHSQADSVPTEMSVSIVAAPWRRLVHVARWKGQPAQKTTGVASTSEAKPQ